MQREQDLTVRAPRAIARGWPVRALPDRLLHIHAFAAYGGVRWRCIATTVCALFVLACGDERPPWSGFPIFPPDAGGFELSPEVASGLLAAQAAFARQIAEQGAPSAAPEATGPSGAGRAAAGSAAPKPPADKDDSRSMPAMTAGSAPVTKPADSGKSAMPNPRTDPVDAGAAAQDDMPSNTEAAAGSPAPADPGDAADGGIRMPEPDAVIDAGPSDAPTPSVDAGTQPSAAGSDAPPSVDAGTQPPAAGSDAPTSNVDAGPQPSDAGVEAPPTPSVDAGTPPAAGTEAPPPTLDADTTPNADGDI